MSHVAMSQIWRYDAMSPQSGCKRIRAIVASIAVGNTNTKLRDRVVYIVQIIGYIRNADGRILSVIVFT